ncbi:non-ribosomal peptide synthetase [Pseudoalteromonas rubra]|uniref:non-ribosomal peptide synthetase n=1 Tax=Pseudoalteromonas rubra TaxID=43658 RepID=UPI001F0C8CFB|nr:non-ribosomal peptide synthetase [Pseudoalteromonas rubra]
MSGALDLNAVEAALSTIIARHEVLHSSYSEIQGEIYQQAEAPYTCQVERFDFSALQGEAQAEAVAQHLTSHGQHIFALDEGQMLSAHYLTLSDQSAVLALNMPHIVSDGWSMQLLVKEFTALYSAHLCGQHAQLAPLPIQYADYAHWQRDWLAGETGASQLNYWKKQLEGVPTVHSLPLQGRRGEIKNHHGESLELTLSQEVGRRLTELASSLEITPFMLLHGALAIVLSRHSNSQDIVIGTPVANRQHADLASLIGFFVNSLVLRLDTSDKTLEAFFAHVKQTHIAAQDNQDIPFEQLVEHLNIDTSTSHSPLFQIMLLTDNDYGLDAPDIDTTRLGEAKLKPLEDPQVTVKFDLDIFMSLSELGGKLKINFDSDLFSAQYIDSLLSHLGNTLANLAQADMAQQTVARLPMLSEQQSHELVVTRNQTQRSYDDEACINTIFERHLAAQPDAPALQFGESLLSYQALNERAEQLASYLVAHHQIVPDTIIGLCMARSAEMIVAMLAILKAGGAYLPLDPDYPMERLEYMIDDAKVAQILSYGRGVEVTDALCHSRDIANLNVSNLSETERSGEQPLGILKSNHSLAYVIYTSGSTGRPKGVGLSHKGAVNLAANQQVLFDITPASRVLQFASISFDAATWDWVMALLNGATLVICDEQARTEGGKLGEVLKQQAITHATLPPALLSTMALQTDLALQCLIVAGEACEEQVVARWRRHYRFFNAYGPSETSVCATVGEITDNSLHIGRPLYNVQTLILDEHQSLVPFGCAGELYVGGDGLARGYLNQPQMTAERFIDNPFYDASVPGSSKRLYRTGDLVRYQADGNLVFIGRTDDQIKIRGFRVELGEIAQQLSLQAGVESALVVAKTGATGTYLVAYLQPAKALSDVPDAEFTQSALTELASQVPDYMVPKLAVVIADWPLTANGKINKKALPEADPQALQGDYVAPANETEQAICEVWAELLGLAPDAISTSANFFHLGGHSLLSVRLAAGLRAKLGVELPVKTLFSAPTIAEQATHIIACRGQAVRQGVQALPRVTREDEPLGLHSVLPQSFAQQRLWFIDQLHSDSAQYNMPAAFEVQGDLELAVVEAALQTIIDRHEVLRTVYRDGEYGAEQVIRQNVPFTLSYEDVRMLSEVQQQQAIAAAMTAQLSQPFNLTRDVMVRAGYLHTSQTSGVLLFNMHHIASDGWSMQVLIKEFITLYQAYSQGEGNPLAPLTLQYADYAQWQRAYLTDALLEQQLGYWQQQLADVPPVHSLVLDHPRPEVKQHQGAQVKGTLSQEVAEGLGALAKAQGLTPFMLLHGALSLLLARHSNTPDIVIGTPVANRMQAELEPLIGFFVNTLVLNVNTAQATMAEYLAHVKAVHLDAQSNQDVPFEQLVEHLKVPRSTAHTPLFQVMLRTQTDYGLNAEMDDVTLSLGGAQLTPMAEESVVAKFDLDVHIALNDSGVDICWTYDTALFNAARIETLNRHLSELLTTLTGSQPEDVLRQVPGTINMLSQAEQHELLVSLNQTEQDYDTQLCIHTLFEQQAQTQPQAIALTGPQREMSYETLNALSNQFAHHLIDHYGIAPGQRVGICVERSEYILVTMLAVLKAGAAYVPFDHHNTLHRNQQIIEDAQLQVVFTDSERMTTLPSDCTHLEVSALEAQLSGQAKRDNPQQSVSASDLAYVIYTSGTTGKPKGVQLRHSNVCDYLRSVQLGYYEQSLSSLLITSYAFDISVPSLFLPLISGASVNILAGDARFESMKHELQVQPYLLRMTPHHGKALVAFMGDEVCSLNHTFVIGGEAFPLELYDQLQAKFPNSVIYNHYGPTEATVGAVALNITAQRDQIGATMPIGKPLPNTKLYILNKELGLVPKGAMGELYIAGPSVSKGYLNRDELTQESFFVNPFEAENSQYNLMYKTGDLARYIGEDYLEYCGRVDEQIKIRGFRIEVGDIESQLLQLPEVDSAVVQAKELAGQRQLVAYVKFDLTHEIQFASSESHQQDNERKLAAIKRSLAGHLPEYMLPSQYLVMTDWPLSANGKLDKKALPAPMATELAAVTVQPSTETEMRLVQVWSEVLQTSAEHISVVESFFSLGGNSLSLMLLLNKLRSEFGAALQLRELYQSSDIQSMAKLIEHLLWMEQDDDDEYEGELLVL